MKVKINEKWFEGRYNEERKFIIPLSEEQDIIFFYKWDKKRTKFGTAKENYTEDIEYKTIFDQQRFLLSALSPFILLPNSSSSEKIFISPSFFVIENS